MPGAPCPLAFLFLADRRRDFDNENWPLIEQRQVVVRAWFVHGQDNRIGGINGKKRIRQRKW